MIELDYMVVPEQLKAQAFVKDPVTLIIVDISKIQIEKILGQSGKLLAENGLMFLFTKELAKELIDCGAAR